MPVRSYSDIRNLKKENIRPTNLGDFREALSRVKATVSRKDLQGYLDWNREFGSFTFESAELDN